MRVGLPVTGFLDRANAHCPCGIIHLTGLCVCIS
jgi:hypothetical protein